MPRQKIQAVNDEEVNFLEEVRSLSRTSLSYVIEHAREDKDRSRWESMRTMHLAFIDVICVCLCRVLYQGTGTVYLWYLFKYFWFASFPWWNTGCMRFAPSEPRVPPGLVNAPVLLLEAIFRWMVSKCSKFARISKAFLFCVSEAGEILGLRAAVRGRPSLLLRTKPIWKGELSGKKVTLEHTFQFCSGCHASLWNEFLAGSWRSARNSRRLAAEQQCLTHQRACCTWWAWCRKHFIGISSLWTLCLTSRVLRLWELDTKD